MSTYLLLFITKNTIYDANVWSVQRSLGALTICTESSLKFSVKRYGLVFRLVKKERD